MYEFNVINLTDEKFKEGNVKFNTSTVTFGDNTEHQLFNTEDSSKTSNETNIITNQPVFEMLEMDEKGFPSVILYCGLVFLASNDISKRDKDFLEQTVNWQQQSEIFVITSGREYVISERQYFRPSKIVLFNLSIPNARVGNISGGASVGSGNFHNASSGNYTLPTIPTTPSSDPKQLSWWQKTLLVIVIILDIMGQVLWTFFILRQNFGDLYKGLFKIPLWIIDKLTGGKYKLVEKYDAFLEKTGLVTAESVEKELKKAMDSYKSDLAASSGRTWYGWLTKQRGLLTQDLDNEIADLRKQMKAKLQEIKEAGDGEKKAKLEEELEKLRTELKAKAAEKRERLKTNRDALDAEYKTFLEEGGEEALDAQIEELEAQIKAATPEQKTALKTQLKTLQSKKELFETANKADRKTIYGNDAEELTAKLEKLFKDAGEEDKEAVIEKFTSLDIKGNVTKEDLENRPKKIGDFFQEQGEKIQNYFDKEFEKIKSSFKTKEETVKEDDAGELSEQLETQIQSILKFAKEKKLNINIDMSKYKPRDADLTKEDLQNYYTSSEYEPTTEGIDITNEDKVEGEVTKLVDEEIPNISETGSDIADKILTELSDKLTVLVDDLAPYKEQIVTLLEPYAAKISETFSSWISSWTRGMEKDAVDTAVKTAEEEAVEIGEDTLRTSLDALIP